MKQSIYTQFPPLGEIRINADEAEVYPPSYYAENFLKILSSENLKDKRVLDIGCGTGILGIAAHRLGANVTCCDLNEKALKWAKKNANLNSVKMKIVHSSGLDAFLGGQQFDLIICNAPSNPGFVDEIITPTNNGPLGRLLLDIALESGGSCLKGKGRLLTCSNSEQSWKLTEQLLVKNWSSYEIVASYDEDFSSLSQFAPDVLDSWVKQGLCWVNGEKVLHNVKYLIATN